MGAGDPALSKLVFTRMHQRRPAMMDRLHDQLKALGATAAELERKNAGAKAKCAADPAYLDAQERVGPRKRKPPTSVVGPSSDP